VGGTHPQRAVRERGGVAHATDARAARAGRRRGPSRRRGGRARSLRAGRTDGQGHGPDLPDPGGHRGAAGPRSGTGPVMDFALPEETAQLERELNRWTSKRSERLGEFDGFDRGDWTELVAFGLPGLTQAGGTETDLVVGLMEVARAGVPGPVVEAQLAL